MPVSYARGYSPLPRLAWKIRWCSLLTIEGVNRGERGRGRGGGGIGLECEGFDGKGCEPQRVVWQLSHGFH